jgi:hypothetical protein
MQDKKQELSDQDREQYLAVLNKKQELSDQDREQYLAVIKEVGLKIDVETAEVFWDWGSERDPYHLFEHGDDWEDCVGRNQWARSPGSKVWVEFGDLPKATQDALWEKHKSQLCDGMLTLGRHLVEVPDSYAIARWPRDADIATIARCVLATLKYEPHTADTAALEIALEGVIRR